MRTSDGTMSRRDVRKPLALTNPKRCLLFTSCSADIEQDVCEVLTVRVGFLGNFSEGSDALRTLNMCGVYQESTGVLTGVLAIRVIKQDLDG